MITVNDMHEISMDARARMREESKNNVDKIIMHYLYPDMQKRACAGHTDCEIMVPDKYRGVDCIGSYLWMIEGKGKNEKSITVYIDDILEYMRELGYEIAAPAWTRLFMISWKKEEKDGSR